MTAAAIPVPSQPSVLSVSWVAFGKRHPTCSSVVGKILLTYYVRTYWDWLVLWDSAPLCIWDVTTYNDIIINPLLQEKIADNLHNSDYYAGNRQLSLNIYHKVRSSLSWLHISKIRFLWRRSRPALPDRLWTLIMYPDPSDLTAQISEAANLSKLPTNFKPASNASTAQKHWVTKSGGLKCDCFSGVCLND